MNLDISPPAAVDQLGSALERAALARQAAAQAAKAVYATREAPQPPQAPQRPVQGS